MSLIEKLQEENAERNFLFTAVERLSRPDEIRRFHNEYVAWMQGNAEDETTQQNPEAVVNANIGYVLGYYSRETAERWMNCLPEVSSIISLRGMLAIYRCFVGLKIKINPLSLRKWALPSIPFLRWGMPNKSLLRTRHSIFSVAHFFHLIMNSLNSLALAFSSGTDSSNFTS